MVWFTFRSGVVHHVHTHTYDSASTLVLRIGTGVAQHILWHQSNEHLELLLLLLRLSFHFSHFIPMINSNLESNLFSFSIGWVLRANTKLTWDNQKHVSIFVVLACREKGAGVWAVCVKAKSQFIKYEFLSKSLLHSTKTPKSSRFLCISISISIDPYQKYI